ncbi:hypothetical protein ACODM8_06460 [Vibrio ostreicida]|uniref:hypothetical protein n=1 Tax=Vibrio ostreicida TaxID=526588 RepID=UPI003B5B6199
MSHILQFKPKTDLTAQANLDAFIKWAKQVAEDSKGGLLYDSFSWDDLTWRTHGVNEAAFTRSGWTASNPVWMESPFVDFAKAIVIKRYCYDRFKSMQQYLDALRALEAALTSLQRAGVVTQITAEVCNTALGCIVTAYNEKRAYSVSLALGKIVSWMHEYRLLGTEFTWVSPLKQPGVGSLKQQEANAEKKLPDDKALKALGEIFNHSALTSLDAVVVSACALMLSVPSRVGELPDVPHKCKFFRQDEDGNDRMFLRWYSEKTRERLPKPVNNKMDGAVDRALELLEPITSEAREYAKWLENNPNTFPPHDGVPNKGPDEPLTYPEMLQSLTLKKSIEKVNNERSIFNKAFLKPLNKMMLNDEPRRLLDDILAQWERGRGTRINQCGYKYEVKFNDRPITLSDLNVLVRARYLPKHFPYTTPPEDEKERIKYSEALFTVRTGALVSEEAVTRVLGFGVEIAAKADRIGAVLGRLDQNNIFERHGYHGLKITSHQFRHYINTEMQKANLSQDLIDLLSGRNSHGSVYNHESINERTRRVTLNHPETKASSENVLEKIATRQPINLSNVTDLQGQKDRVIHQTHLGICVHNFAETPCPKMGACLTCGLLGCVKGDEAKLDNLKGEREALIDSYEEALKAQSEGEIGSIHWLNKAIKDLAKCDALIKVLENTDIENGAVVWNQDDGWSLTSNAAVMAGLTDVKAVEAEIRKATLPSLADIAEMNKIGD